MQFDVDTIDCIQLMNAEYNMTNKYINRHAVALVERAKETSPDQYGRKNYHKAIHVVLNKILSNNFLQQNWSCGRIEMNIGQKFIHTITMLVSLSFEFLDTVVPFCQFTRHKHLLWLF